MIGGGGRIGGPPPNPGASQVQTPAEASATTSAGAAGKTSPGDKPGSVTTGGVSAPRDGFEKGAALRAGLGAPTAAGLGAEKMVNLHELARENPAAAKQMLATMQGQTDHAAQKLQSELAAGKVIVEQLSAKRFSKAALEEKRAELRRKREKLQAMQMRLRMTKRKMSLLQQLAGQLDEPELEEQFSRLLGNHKKLQTDWGRHHHLLDVADLFYGADEATPDHLREVIKAEIRAGSAARRVSERLESISPRRVISELIARTLDGSPVTVGDEDPLPVDSLLDYGTVLQSWAGMSEIMIEALAKDPLASKRKPNE